jgi:M6 family metalloprotease-like protein
MRWVSLVIGIAVPRLVGAAVAYPGDWTAHQPDQDSLGVKQVIVGTPSYFYTVAETIEGFYTTIKDQSDGFIKYAQLDPSTGEFVPSKFIVGRDDPVENKVPERVLEKPNVIENKCLKNPYCSWKRNHDGVTGSAPSGQYRNLVIPFKFADHSDRDLNLDDLKDLFNGDHLSVKDYFETQSYNKITMVNEFAPETVIGRTESYCADNASGLTLVVHECLAEALAEKQTGGYDTITFVHSGYGAEYGNQDQYDTYFDDRLWGHSWAIDAAEYSGRYSLISAFFGTENGRVQRVGAPVHEIAQAMGAPTQYGDYPGYGLGYYDVMANPWGFDGTLYHCGSMSAYTKALLGWVDVEEITSDGTRAIAASSISNKVYMISNGYPMDEYLLIENRESTGYDKGLRQPGLAVYHIDPSANGKAGHPDDDIYPSNHYKVALIQADGRFDLERMEDFGDMGDLFHHDRFGGFGPDGPIGPDGSVLSERGGHPNTNSYRGGKLAETGITISDISKASSEMSFTVALEVNSS